MSESQFRLFSGTSHPVLAQEVAQALSTELGRITIKKFACQETYVRIEESVRGKDVYLIQTSTHNVNEDLMELFLMADAMRTSFAKKVHVIMPHYAYARQDRISLPRETISAKLIADLLVKSGVDHVVTFNLHSDQIQGFFDVPVDNINARNLFTDYIKTKDLADPIVVSPDEGGAKAAKRFADDLGCPLAIMHKTRAGHNVSAVTHVVGDIKGKTPILYDDMVDTAGSVCNAKDVLVREGANPEMYLVATHPIFSGLAEERLTKANFKEIIVTNSIETSQFMIPNLKTVSIAPLISEVIRNVNEERSVSSLF